MGHKCPGCKNPSVMVYKGQWYCYHCKAFVFVPLDLTKEN